MHKLPLTLFERYLFHEDRPAYPCWILIRYLFSGTFQREVLQRAWEAAAERHPLLSAVVGRDWPGRLSWVPAPGFRPRIEWGGKKQDSGWPEWPAIDLEKAPGFHLLAFEEGGSTELFAQVHHSLHDGAGAFAILNDLLVYYARELGAGVEPGELRPELLPDRNGFGLSLWDKVKLLPAQALGLAVSLQLHRRAVASLSPGSAVPDAAPPPSVLPALASRRFPPGEFEMLHDAAKQRGVWMYDLLIRDTQAALGRWLKENGKAGPLEWTRLLLPVNLRRPADLCLPSANLVGLVILDRRAKSLANRERLLVRAREDMGWVRRKKLGYTFLVLLWFCRLMPGGIRAYSRRRICRATLLLTNLGQVMAGSPLGGPGGKIAVPGAVLEDVSLAAPVRPGTQAGLAVGVYANRLWADLSYDPRVLSAAQAEGLVQAFADEIMLSIG